VALRGLLESGAEDALVSPFAQQALSDRTPRIVLVAGRDDLLSCADVFFWLRSMQRRIDRLEILVVLVGGDDGTSLDRLLRRARVDARLASVSRPVARFTNLGMHFYSADGILVRSVSIHELARWTVEVAFELEEALSR